MTGDIRDARFYLVDESASAPNTEPLEFEEAFAKAHALADAGSTVRVLYTEEASQSEITRLVSHGIPTALVSGA
ncbi:hypothetical protein [Rhizobium sp. LjRoot254]|uniref:hypothetical protein n=1 Tax=Rhizobium sp. LjRoot254 TaxID=3342297 RepID=UPI003ECCDBA3